MPHAISRKQFLRGDFRNQHAPLRPPWAYAEDEFVDKCTRCGECLSHCPEKIIVKDKHGFPKIDFSRGECLLCHECVDQCEPEALSQDLDRPPWNLKAEITEKCLVYKGVHCMVCREQCESEAISFTYKAGLPPMPHLNLSLCNGCGACFKPCPGQAINLSYQHQSHDQQNDDQSQKDQNKENAS